MNHTIHTNDMNHTIHANGMNHTVHANGCSTTHTGARLGRQARTSPVWGRPAFGGTEQICEGYQNEYTKIIFEDGTNSYLDSPNRFGVFSDKGICPGGSSRKKEGLSFGDK